jgi:MFS family permease
VTHENNLDRSRHRRDGCCRGGRGAEQRGSPLGLARPGVVGGLIAGGLIAGALAPHYYDYGYYPAYGGYDGAYCWRRAWNGWRWVHYRAC